MNPYYEDADCMGTLYEGHVLDVLAQIDPESVSCVVTSPPYWSLRKYDAQDVAWPDGWVGQFGLEESPERYVEHTLAVLRAIRRVLRPDGIMWRYVGIELSDRYAAMAAEKLRRWWDVPTLSDSNAPDGQAILPLGSAPLMAWEPACAQAAHERRTEPWVSGS